MNLYFYSFLRLFASFSILTLLLPVTYRVSVLKKLDDFPNQHSAAQPVVITIAGCQLQIGMIIH